MDIGSLMPLTLVLDRNVRIVCPDAKLDNRPGALTRYINGTLSYHLNSFTHCLYTQVEQRDRAPVRRLAYLRRAT